MCWRFWIHSVTGWSLSHKDCSCIVHVPAVNLPTVNISCWGLNGTHRHWSPELIYAPFPLDRSEFWIGKRYYQGGQHWCCDNIVLVFVWNLPPFFFPLQLHQRTRVYHLSLSSLLVPLEATSKVLVYWPTTIPPLWQGWIVCIIPSRWVFHQYQNVELSVKWTQNAGAIQWVRQHL